MAAPMEEGANCSLGRYFDSPCGKSDKFSDSFLFNLTDCDKKIAGHLRECKVSQNIVNEGHLIALRAGIWNWTSNTDRGVNVCGAHRHQYGLGWRPTVRCGFVRHNAGSLCKSQRGMSSQMCELAQLRWGHLCRVGTGICRQCLNQVAPCHMPENSIVKEEMDQITEDSSITETSIKDITKTELDNDLENEFENRADGVFPITDTHEMEPTEGMETSSVQHSEEILSAHSSQSTIVTFSQQSNWSDDCVELKLPKINMIMESLNVSPLRSQLKTNMKDVKPSTVRYYKRKAEESIDNILDLIAPSQGKILKEEIMPFDDSANNESNLMDTLSKMYMNTDNNSLKTQILSVLSKKMTKAELQNKFPGLTLYRIDQARAVYNKNSTHRLEVQERTLTHRHKMDDSKVEHAMAFFSDPAFMQLVSYGTKEMTLDSGECITIPEVIRTTCHAKMIELYSSYCEDTGFSPLSKSSLFRILNSCEAKRRTNLHGLDNITADGIDGFESLSEITLQLNKDSLLSGEQYDEVKKNIIEAKSYLKADFKVHLEKDSLCADHCLNWLLSDPSNEHFQTSCNHEHTLKCDRCELFKSIEEKLDTVILQMQNGDKKEEMKKKYNDAMVNIHGWKSHIIRTVNQDLFRLHILENLKRYEGVLIMDWAMKFLPMRHREKQTDWFGQRGIHWHVSVLIYRDEEGEIGHRTFTHVMENVKQDWYAVASLVEHVLTTVKKQLPHVTDVYLRSDNAGCYHCGHLWLSIPRITDVTGINICHYSYSEAQAGKSYCDSKIAHMRTKMRSYVANGHDILSADDMKTAIDHGSGVTGCQVSYVSIDTENHVLRNHSLKNISQYNDVIYTSNKDMIVRKQYNVGQGLTISQTEYSSLTPSRQDKFGCVIIRDFCLPLRMKGHIKINRNEGDQENQDVTNQQLQIPPMKEERQQLKFECPEIGCTKAFASHKTLDRHLILGKHNIKVYRESTYDLIRKQWAELCNNVVVIVGKRKEVGSKNSVSIQGIERGYGLKKAKKVNRFPTSVKVYLEQKFEEGEKSGKKCLPKDVEAEMRNLRDKDGNRIFELKDCLNSSQILSYFSRLSSKKSKV